MSVEYVDLVDYIAIASEITGLEVATVMRVAKLDLADSARRRRASAKRSSIPTSSTRQRC